MLVLSRLPEQTVRIKVKGIELLVKVVSVDRGKVRLGFAGPHDFSILRGELVDREAYEPVPAIPGKK